LIGVRHRPQRTPILAAGAPVGGAGGRTMSTLHALELGILAGITLFFVLQRMGILDRWFDHFSR